MTTWLFWYSMLMEAIIKASI